MQVCRPGSQGGLVLSVQQPLLRLKNQTLKPCGQMEDGSFKKVVSPKLALDGQTRTVTHPPCSFHPVIFLRSPESVSRSAQPPSDIELMLRDYQQAHEEAKEEIARARDQLREQTEQEKLRIHQQIVSQLLRVWSGASL